MLGISLPWFRGLRSGLSGGRIVRLAVTISVLMVSACVLLSVVLVRRHLGEMRRELDTRGRTLSQFLARESELGIVSGNVDELRKLAEVVRTEPDVAYVRFFERDGRLLASIDFRRARAAQAAANAGHTWPAVLDFRAPITMIRAPQRREELGFGADEAVESAREGVGAVTLGIALDDYEHNRHLAVMTALAFTTGVTLLAGVSAILLSLGPLRALASAADLADERSRVAELKAHFVTMASHEFRTPLAVILGAADVLRRYRDRMTEQQHNERLLKIQRAVRQMTDLLEDVLVVGRADAGKLQSAPEPLDLDSLCREVVTDVEGQRQGAHDIRVRVETDTDEEPALDRKLVRQVLRNLLGNAVKYSPQGGIIELTALHRDGRVRFRVSDQGIGIPLEDHAHLFEPFHRAANVGKINGSGLGLAITQRAVRAHGGTIAVESAVGKGTTFIVDLPSCPAPAQGKAV